MEEADVSVMPITHGKKSVFLVAACLSVWRVCQCVMPIAEGKKVQEFVSRVTLYTSIIIYENTCRSNFPENMQARSTLFAYVSLLKRVCWKTVFVRLPFVWQLLLVTCACSEDKPRSNARTKVSRTLPSDKSWSLSYHVMIYCTSKHKIDENIRF